MPLTLTPSVGAAKKLGVAGTKLYIGGTTAASLTTDTYEELGTVATMPDLGASDNEIPIELIGDPLKFTAKGVTDPGGGEFMFLEDFSEAGLADLAAAQLDRSNDYNFLIEFPNIITPTTGNGTRYFFRAKVLSYNTGLGGPNDYIKAKCNIKLNSRITRVAAA